ncbi:MAG: hypothetical protein IKO05_00115 [Selenomonadaceae bacterium]|nr:hypothetical protein [Selenomonadaceae bacterium]
MEVAPLIHSRTEQCDYNPKFAVRPKDFSEIQWARSKILAATRNIDRFNGIRRIVAAKNGVCIAGIVCTMKYFVNNCLTGADKDVAQLYIGVHGRLYGVFLGYSFKGNTNEIPDVNYSDLWQWFKKYLVPEWEKKSARTVEVDYFSWDKVKHAHAKNHGTEFYDSATFNEESLFEEYLARALTEEVAFCSNVENIQAVEDGIYTAVTTSASNVDKLKANMERKRLEREEQIRREKEESERQKKLPEQEKKTSKSSPTNNSSDQIRNTSPTSSDKKQQYESTNQNSIWLILLILLIILGAIAYWWTHKQENDLESHLSLENHTQLFRMENT